LQGESAYRLFFAPIMGCTFNNYVKYALNGWPVICQVSLIRFEKSVLASRSLTKLMPCHSNRFETGLNNWLFGKIVINIQAVSKKMIK
jgi:hypothetical protein